MFKQTNKLLQNNSGRSIKSWLIFWAVIQGIFLLNLVAFIMVWDVVQDGKVDTNINDLATFVTAIVALFGVAGLPKIAGEISEGLSKRKSEKTEEIDEH